MAIPKNNTDNTGKTDNMFFIPLPNLGLLSGVQTPKAKIAQNASIIKLGGDFTGVNTATTISKPKQGGQ